jgi:hypothetical protein
MKGLYFPAQTYNFSHSCPGAERIKVGLYSHGDWIKGGGPIVTLKNLGWDPFRRSWPPSCWTASKS